MTEAKKEKKKFFVSPIGTAAYPRVNGKPDTKFDENGVWSVKLKFKSVKEKGVQEMLDRLEAVIAQAKKDALADKDYVAGLKKKGKKAPSEADRSFFVDDETGEVTVNFKMRASGISKKTKEPWSMRPAVFGADGKPLAADAKVGSGSQMQVSYTASPFYTALGYGASIRLEAVRVVELVEWGGGDASQYGFEVSETDDETDAPEDAEEGGDAADGDDF